MVRSNFSFTSSCIGFITIVITSVCSFTSTAFADYRDYVLERAPLYDLAYLDPLDEVRLQAALLDEQAGPGSDANLNRRLRDVDIRTSLQDTLRLHWDLG